MASLYCGESVSVGAEETKLFFKIESNELNFLAI
jgi:hypothetical protein